MNFKFTLTLVAAMFVCSSVLAEDVEILAPGKTLTLKADKTMTLRCGTNDKPTCLIEKFHYGEDVYTYFLIMGSNTSNAAHNFSDAFLALKNLINTGICGKPPVCTITGGTSINMNDTLSKKATSWDDAIKTVGELKAAGACQ